MVELSEDSIKQIKDNLDSVADTINEAIDDVQNNPDNKQEEKEQKQEENIVDKEKSSVSSQEKKRFAQIGQIFIDQWVKSIEKLQTSQAKQLALSTSKKEVEPSWLSKLLNRKNAAAVQKKPDKKGTSWLKKLLQVIGVLGLVYVLFKDKIDKVMPEIIDWLKTTGLKLIATALVVVKGVIPLVRIGLTTLSNWLIGLGKDVMILLGKQLKGLLPLIGKGLSWLNSRLVALASKANSKLLGGLGKGLLGVVAGALIGLVASYLPQIWEWLKSSVSSMWDWIKEALPFDQLGEYLSSAWETFSGFIGGIFDGMAGIFNGIIDAVLGIPKKVMEWVFGGIGKAIGAIGKAIKSILPSWLGGGDDKPSKDDKKPKKKEPDEVQAKVDKKVEKKEIKLKDDMLETIKEICDRLNLFFSSKSGGFVDLSKAAIKEFTSGFAQVKEQMKKIQLNNVYEVSADVAYKDKYNWDQSDRSQRSISNYNKIVHETNRHNNYKNYIDRKFQINNWNTNLNKYDVNYHTIDIPALERTIRTLENKTNEEIEVLRSQNDWFSAIIRNMDGLGKKLEWLDPSKLETEEKPSQPPFVPLLSTGGDGSLSIGAYNASVMKSVQASMARALAT